MGSGTFSITIMILIFVSSFANRALKTSALRRQNFFTLNLPVGDWILKIVIKF